MRHLEHLEHKDLKYMHVEHWDTDEVMYLKNSDDLAVQPKIDGTNCLVAFDNGQIIIGSRNRLITPEDDNQGCAKYIFENLYDRLIEYFSKYPDNILYGEYTIVHTFKVKPEFLGKFYIFDVFDRKSQTYRVPDSPETECGFDIVPTMLIKQIRNIPDLPKYIQENLKDFGKFLMEDSFETGEGFVIKDYNKLHKNKYGRICWAKVLNEKPRVAGKNLWEKIRNDFFTDAWIEKETVKYLEKNNITEIDNFQKYTNILTNEFIKEECANIVFKYKYPNINFQILKGMIYDILKEKYDKSFKLD